MPSTAAARGLSALAGFGLFLAGIVFCYLNSTTSTATGSMIYVTGLVVISLAMAAKWSAALGVESKVMEFADRVASVVPWIALYFVGLQAMHFKHDGLDGFMACVSIMALTFLVAFGAFDSVASMLGHKYQEAVEAASEVSKRAQAATDVLRTGTRN